MLFEYIVWRELNIWHLESVISVKFWLYSIEVIVKLLEHELQELVRILLGLAIILTLLSANSLFQIVRIKMLILRIPHHLEQVHELLDHIVSLRGLRILRIEFCFAIPEEIRS